MAELGQHTDDVGADQAGSARIRGEPLFVPWNCSSPTPRQRIGLTFVASALYRFVSTRDLGITPEKLFEVLGDERFTTR